MSSRAPFIVEAQFMFCDDSRCSKPADHAVTINGESIGEYCHQHAYRKKQELLDRHASERAASRPSVGGTPE